MARDVICEAVLARNKGGAAPWAGGAAAAAAVVVAPWAGDAAVEQAEVVLASMRRTTRAGRLTSATNSAGHRTMHPVPMEGVDHEEIVVKVWEPGLAALEASAALKGEVLGQCGQARMRRESAGWPMPFQTAIPCRAERLFLVI